MSKSIELSKQREGTVLNELSKQQEYNCVQIVEQVIEYIYHKYNVNLVWKKRLKLIDIVNKLQTLNPNTEYSITSSSSYIQPDGGLVCIVDKEENIYPILIPEVKTQGTNTKRIAEGKKEQAKGNAIERLGKNVIVIKEYMRNEDINPFVCFGQGCDFAKGSTILDRVAGIAGFRPINKIDMTGDTYGSFFFREQPWTANEMKNIFIDIAEVAIKYYQQKYSKIFNGGER